MKEAAQLLCQELVSIFILIEIIIFILVESLIHHLLINMVALFLKPFRSPFSSPNSRLLLLRTLSIMHIHSTPIWIIWVIERPIKCMSLINLLVIALEVLEDISKPFAHPLGQIQREK